MRAAAGSVYLGAVIFAGAAAVAGMLAMLLWFPFRPDHQLGIWLWSVARAGIAAGISAGLSFVLLDRIGWRLRRGPLLARAAMLGAATVVGSHLLIGFMTTLLLGIEATLLTEWRFDLIRDLLIVPMFVSVYSFFAILVTLPLGIAVAGLVESLERRNSLATDAKAAE